MCLLDNMLDDTNAFTGAICGVVCVHTQYTGKYHISIYNGHFIGRRPSLSVGGQQYPTETQYMDLERYIASAVCWREALTSETTLTSGSAFINNTLGGDSKLASLLTKSSYVCIVRLYSGVGSSSQSERNNNNKRRRFWTKNLTKQCMKKTEGRISKVPARPGKGAHKLPGLGWEVTSMARRYSPWC